MRVRTPLLVCVVAVLAVSSACGDDDQPLAVGDTTTTRPTVPTNEAPDDESAGSFEAPPGVTVRSATSSLDLQPWTYCYANGCADGQGNGDLFVSFQWTTTQDGPMPIPTARLAVIADHDGTPDSYGVELELSNLASTPAQASATVSVTSSGGDSVTFAATRPPDCIAEGTVYWDGPDDQGLAAAQLGEAPFTYEVEVTLDGISYRATARWPDNQIEGNEPSVVLDFTPALPSLFG